MNKIETRMRQLRKQLDELQRKKRKARNPRVPTGNGRGRPKVDPAEITIAKTLAKEFPIPDVALKTGLSIRTMSNYGITRQKLDREKRQQREAAVAAGSR